MALAVPYPPSVAQPPTETVPDTFKFNTKPVNGGNFMPGTKTTPQPPSAGYSSLQRRATGETVTIAADANWDSSNIYDGVGNGVDQYTLYLGDGSTSQGWPDKSSWVSFDNM